MLRCATSFVARIALPDCEKRQVPTNRHKNRITITYNSHKAAVQFPAAAQSPRYASPQSQISATAKSA